MKKGRKQISILIVFALILSMMPIYAKAAMPEIQEGTEWSGTINGKKYFTFTPEETGYYDVSIRDTDEVTTDMIFYTAQDGKELRNVGEAFDGTSNKTFYRNAVYLAGGVTYNLKVGCYIDEETETTENVSFSFRKSQDSIYELGENRQPVNAICNGNAVMRFTPEETSVYTLNLDQKEEEYISVDLYELIDGELICIEEQNKYFYETANQMDFFLEKGKEYYFELYFSGDLEDGDEIPVFVQLVQGKNVSSISIDEIEFYDCYSKDSILLENFLKLRINYTDGTSKLSEYKRDDFGSAGIDVVYAGEYNEDETFHYGEQKVKVIYLGKFSDETTVYVKKKVESLDEKNKLEIGDVITADLRGWYSEYYLIKPTQNGYYDFSYYLDYGQLSECLEDWKFYLWDSEDRKLEYDTDGFKLKAGETYFLWVMLLPKDEKQDSMTNFRYYLGLSKNHVHTYGEWVIVKEATENAVGEKKRICSSCEYEEVRIVGTTQVSTPSNNQQSGSTAPIATPFDTSHSEPQNKSLAPTVVKKLTVKNKKKKSVNVSWKKVSGTTGYEIQYADNKKFKKKKTKSVKKRSTVIKKLKKRKTYYFRIRAYKLSGKKKIYGKWSKVKRIKIKK